MSRRPRQHPLPSSRRGREPVLMRAVVYAVALGANTAQRLAAEWGVSADSAMSTLRRAVARGHIERVERGVYLAYLPEGEQ